MDYRTVVKICLLFLAGNIQLASAATHSMQYMVTAVTPGISYPEYTMVGMVDGEQFVYYDSDSRKVIPKTEWMKKIEEDDYWTSETQISHGNEDIYKERMNVLMKRFNQSKGVHTFQWMYGCELDDDGTKIGYSQYGYDGEDFLILDLDTLTWIAPVRQAVPTKRKWEVTESGDWARQIKNYLENQCTDWLQKYVGYGRSTLERKVAPEVSLFQKDSSSEVVCHATGFFPKAVMISWQKNGEDLYEDVELRQTMPNQDGTFQKRSILYLSPEELKNNNYTCVVLHSSLEKDLVLKVSDRRIPPVAPEVSVFSSDSSSPVVCHATAFFPKPVMISWQKNGEDLNEDVELRETLPNQDGTFQKRSVLTLSPEELKNSDEYTSVVQHQGLMENLVLKVSDRRILSGGVSVGVIVGVVVVALIVIIAIVGVVVRKKTKGFKPVPGSDSSSNNS